MVSYQKHRRMTLDLLFHQIAAAMEHSPYIARCREKTTVLRDIAYCKDGGKAHLLDIYKPKKFSGKLPVLLYIHGGGFVLCSKETHRGAALVYARSGFLVFNINYRLAPAHRFPAALSDVCQAYQWIIENAAAYGGDVNRLVVAGESAGANLSLALAIAACHERPEPAVRAVRQTGIVPAAVLCIEGLLQVSDPRRLIHQPRSRNTFMGAYAGKVAKDVAKAYLGRDYRLHTPSRELADPLVILENTDAPQRPYPPFFVAVGTGDIVCNDTERLERALLRQNASVEARYYPNEPHVFHFMFWRKAAIDFWKDNFRFLNKHIALPATI